MKQETLLERLRLKTHTLHKLVEETSISKSLMNSELTRDQYIGYLQRVLIMHTDTEKNVFPLISPYIKDLAERQKSDKILRDLKSLNSVIKISNFDFIDKEFQATVNFSFGIMYLIEGSTLGGVHLLRNIQAVLGREGDVPRLFLNAYGNETGSKWKNFIFALTDYEKTSSEKDADEILDGAIYGFKRAYELFKTN